MNKRLIAPLLTMLFFFCSYQLQAANWTDKVKINGFANAIYQQTGEQIAIHGASNEGGIDDRGSFTGTSVGFNITANINERVTLYSQLSASHQEGFTVQVDWGFIGIELSETFTLRAGNIKFPVGLVNEYADVGYLYPWLRAPSVIYSSLTPAGPQVVRDGYSGASLLYSESIGDWVLGADLFGGEVKMENIDVRETRGLTLRAEWNDQVLIQASTYTGLMESTTNAMMNGQDHDVTTLGIKVDIDNFVFYAEHANVEMGSLAIMKATTWYTTLGYRIDKWLPYYTYEDFDKGANSMSSQLQNFNTLGLRYELMPNTALKMEVTQVKTDIGKGFFTSAPADNSTRLYGLGLNVMF